jgi:hypothetical protein
LSRKRIRNTIVAGAATLALGAGMFAGLGPVVSTASSHREAPLTSADPQIDITDLYAFVSPDKPGTVSFVSSWIPFEEPAGGPNFYLWAENTNYDIRIDNDGDASADIIYTWKFKTHYRNPDSFIYNNGPVTALDDENLLIYQTYDLFRSRGSQVTQLLNDSLVAPSNVGAASMPSYNDDLFDAAVEGVGSTRTRSWVGQSDDPFFLDLRVFDLLYGANFSEAGDDTLDGFNVNTFAIQVPKSQLRGPHDQVIGVWSTAQRPSMRVQGADGSQTFSGKNVQVSRLGMPLVNEVVVPVGAKDYFNASKPKNDAQFLGKVQDPELPRLVNAVYPSAFPNIPDSDAGTPGIQRADLIQVFLTGIPGLNQPTNVQPSEMLRLNMAIAPCSSACSTLGVIGGDLAGFPNGRRLDDDIVDVALRVTMGVLLPGHDAAADTLGDGVGANDLPFNAEFPYVAYPSSGSDVAPHS